MSERQIFFQLPTKYVPRSRTSHHMCDEYNWVLVLPEALQNQHKENGGAWNIIFTKFELNLQRLVHHNKYSHGLDTFMGHAWDLDKQDRVCSDNVFFYDYRFTTLLADSIISGSSGMYDYLTLKSMAELLHRAYNIVWGLFQAPYYPYSQTMMAELTPPGFEYMASGILR